MTDDFLKFYEAASAEPPAILSTLNECPVCLDAHDEEIHQATLSVRQWFRGEVTKSFQVLPPVV